jgi:hypothetical protein
MGKTRHKTRHYARHSATHYEPKHEQKHEEDKWKVEKAKNGRIIRATNPKGKKAAVRLVEIGNRPGISARYTSGRGTVRGSSGSNVGPKAYARKLLKSGHKSVEFGWYG